MAKATSTITQVPVTTYVNKTVINLELTMAETETLREILSRVGGDLENSPRKYADSVLKEVKKICVTYKVTGHAANCVNERENRAIYFKPGIPHSLIADE